MRGRRRLKVKVRSNTDDNHTTTYCQGYRQKDCRLAISLKIETLEHHEPDPAPEGSGTCGQFRSIGLSMQVGICPATCGVVLNSFTLGNPLRGGCIDYNRVKSILRNNARDCVRAASDERHIGKTTGKRVTRCHGAILGLVDYINGQYAFT